MAPKTDPSDLSRPSKPSAKALAKARKDFDAAGKKVGARPTRGAPEPADEPGEMRGADLIAHLAAAGDDELGAAPGTRPDDLPDVWDAGGEEHPAEGGLGDEEATAGVEVAEDGQPQDAGDSPLDERARSYLKLKIPGLTDTAIDAIPDPQAFYRGILEREANVDRAFADRAELMRQAQEREAASQEVGAPSAVPADSLDLAPPPEVLEAFGLEADGDGAKALERWIRGAIAPLADELAQTRGSMKQAAERAIAAQRERLASASPHLASSDAAWRAVRGRAEELAADLQRRGQSVNGTALFDQALREITGAAPSAPGGAPGPQQQSRNGGRSPAAKAAAAPSSASRKGAPDGPEGSGMSSRDIARRVYDALDPKKGNSPYDTTRAKALDFKLRRAAGLEKRL